MRCVSLLLILGVILVLAGTAVAQSQPPISEGKAEAYYNRGVAWQNKGQYDQAIADYGKALEINPRYAEAYSNRGAAWQSKGQYDQAIADYGKALEINPRYAEAYYNRGVAWQSKGRYDQAIADYGKALEINPRYAEAYSNRGNAWQGKGQYDQAIADYGKALEINPRYAEAYFNKGFVCEKAGRIREAIEAYRGFVLYASGGDSALIELARKELRDLAREEAGAKQKPALDVPYVPSTVRIARAMLDMARVTSTDMVYDLGCGDGRIVIMAARERRAKGIGVDLDPVLVKESKRHAKEARVTGLVQFFQQNLFETDISGATVVMLYLWPEVNLKLRPKLMRDLRPGTRVVSHSHTMGDWTPDDERTVEGHNLYLFIVPANATGTWRWTDRDGRDASLRVTQRFQQGECRMEAGKDLFTVKNCALRGDLLTFSSAAGDRVLFFEGRIAGDVIRGQVKDSAGLPVEGWKALRDPSTRLSIAE